MREATTVPEYRLWSIGDRHPAMIRVGDGGVAVAVEVWRVPAVGLAAILLAEPPGLCIGKVRLADGEETLGVLGEPALCEGQREITRHGGWRAYVASHPMSEPARVTEAEVEALAALVGLSIDPAYRAAVAQQLTDPLGVAPLVTDFPLPDDVEPAPVFRP